METKWNQNKPKQAKMKIKKAKKYKSEQNKVKQIENKFKIGEQWMLLLYRTQEAEGSQPATKNRRTEDVNMYKCDV
jgi:hypothetical protein